MRTAKLGYQRAMTASFRHVRRLAAATVIAAASAAPGVAQEARVAITAIVEHPTLDTMRDGIIDVLISAGYVDGDNLELVFESAEADAAKAADIAARFAAARPDAIVAISAPSALAVAATPTEVPIVVVGVGEADARRLAEARPGLGGRLTAVFEQKPPVAAQLRLVRRILPEVRTVTVPYDADDDSGTVARLQEAAAAAGLALDPVPVAGDADLAAAIARGAGETGAIYLPLDSLAARKVDAFFADETTAYPPVFAASPQPVIHGALATIGYDPYEIGRQAGRLVVRILDGEGPAGINLQPAIATHLVLNIEAADLMGITVPADVLGRASEIIEPPGPRPRAKPPVPERPADGEAAGGEAVEGLDTEPAAPK